MHSQFSEWFRTAKIPQEDSVLQKRWVGAENFQVDRGDVVALVEVFFGNLANKDAFLEAFRKAFQTADSSFRMRDNDLELSVLAGATLVTVMDDADQNLSDLATIGLITSAAQNLRKAPCVPEIPEIAAQHLTMQSVKRNQLHDNDKADLDDARIEVKQLRRDLDLLGEETNVLWWVFGEASRESNLRWNTYSAAEIAIMSGKELADLVKLGPGPAAAGALLERILRTAKTKISPLTIQNAIEQLPGEWKQKFLESRATELKNLAPVTHGIRISLELEEKNAWIQSLPSAIKVQQIRKITPRLLAYQVYLECILCDLWKKSK